MNQEWQFGRAAGTCSRCGRALQAGEHHRSALLEEGDAFRRVDSCLECWAASPPAGATASWTTTVPKKDAKKRRVIDDDLVRNLFDRCEGATEPVKINFRFVLGLMLMRRRVLKYETTRNVEGVEIWTLRPADGGMPVEMINPRLDEEGIAKVSEELSAVLDADPA